MCEELYAEIEEGRRLALALARHVIAMGGGRCQIPVFVEDEAYRIVVEHIPVAGSEPA